MLDRSAVRPSGFRGPAADAYKIGREEFERHLDAIARVAPRVPVSLAAEAWDASRPVFLTFDDGGASAAETIADSLERRGWRGHFLVTTDFIGRRGFLTADEIRSLRRRGHIIGSHSRSHPHLIASCGWNELVQEWSVSSDVLSEILGERIRVASLPGDDYARPVAAAAAAAGFRVLFTSIPTTKTWTVDGCTVIGRYVVKAGTHSERLATLVVGNRWPRLRQGAIWGAKRVLKAAGRPILKHRLQQHPPTEQEG